MYQGNFASELRDASPESKVNFIDTELAYHKQINVIRGHLL